MSLFYANGSSDRELLPNEIKAALFGVFDMLGSRKRVLAVPPDYTRAHSYAGPITCLTHEYYGERLADIMPALGTHDPMTIEQWQKMYPSIPFDLMRVHNWRKDVLTIGEVPSEYTKHVTEGIYEEPWPVQVNSLLVEGGHDLILSIGQVVPHEVIGMANHTKNLFVGTGGPKGINTSHFIGAAFGMERMMGHADTPLRRILNYAHEHFCAKMPVVFIQTVMDTDENGKNICRGLYIGDDRECFERAAELSAQVNITVLDERADKIVVFLDADEFQSTWLGNKAVYRTRMAMADGGELVILAPGVKTFGEDAEIDTLIRKYGYRTTPQIMKFVSENKDLQNNLAAAAHLIHGSSEGRFKVTYCPGGLTRAEIEGVGYEFSSLKEMKKMYNADSLRSGWNVANTGERFYYVNNPALGLWRGHNTPGAED